MRLYFSELRLLQQISAKLETPITLIINKSKLPNKGVDAIEYLCNGDHLQVSLFKDEVHIDYTNKNNSYSDLLKFEDKYTSIDELVWATELHLHEVSIWVNSRKFNYRNIFFHYILEEYMDKIKSNNILIAIESQRKLSFLYVLDGIIFKSYRTIGSDKFTEIKEKFYMTSFSALFKKSNAHIIGVSNIEQINCATDFKDMLLSCTDIDTYKVKFKGGV